MKVQAFLEAYDLLKTTKEDRLVPFLPTNLASVQIKSKSKDKAKKSKDSRLCSILWQIPGSTESLLVKQQKMLGID